MPIDLTSYTKIVRDTLKRTGLGCVYVAVVDGSPLCRVGYAEDLPITIGRLQRSSPAPIQVDSALWVPNRAIATNISKAVQCDLIASKASGGWLDTPAAAATLAIELAAFRIHPGALMVWHDQLMAQWKTKPVRHSGNG